MKGFKYIYANVLKGLNIYICECIKGFKYIYANVLKVLNIYMRMYESMNVFMI